MRYIRYAFLGTVGAVLLILAIANREVVTLEVLPQEIAEFAGWNASIGLPLFVIIFGGVVAGLLIGFVWEWLREYKHRAAAVQHKRERDRLEREVGKLREPAKGSADEVLAILDNGAAKS